MSCPVEEIMKSKIIIDINNDISTITYEKEDISYPICTINSNEFYIDERTYKGLIKIIAQLLKSYGSTLLSQMRNLTQK